MADGADPPEIIQLGDGLGVEYPAEPLDLRARLRSSAEPPVAGPADTPDVEGSFAAWLWERWMSALEPGGLQREAFVDLVHGYRREIWYWLQGDRGWDQLIAGLAGRVSRRVETR